jgi:hypothetical protein
VAKFIRLVRENERMELLLNVEQITKIEVKYGVPSKNPEDRKLYGVVLRDGISDPAAIRLYTVFIGGESYPLPGVTDDPVVRVIQEIYENAIRTPEPHDRPDAETDS